LDGVARVLTAGRAHAPTRVRPFLDAAAALRDPGSLARLATEHGYLFIRGLVARATVMSLRSEVLDQCARRGWLVDGAPRSRGIARRRAASSATDDALLLLQGDVQIRPAFAELRRHAAILAVLESVMHAVPVPGYGDVCRLAFPNDVERTTPPHQDYFYTRGSTALWTVWIPLGDCSSSLGGLAVLPGSHSRGLLPHDGGAGDARFIELDADAAWAGASYRAGDVLMLSALTVHAARPNVTADRIRVSVDFRYQPASS
jgi:hypothetical protein